MAAEHRRSQDPHPGQRSYVYEEVDASGGQIWFESGFVIVDGNEIELNAQQDSDGAANEATTLTFTLGGGQLTLTLAEGGSTFVFTLTM